ncbi:MAG: FHA domain-containing protein [Deltaproteobacteria bacterium]|nr:FHA domain-containing protein [Deltaproteobacteria bacterium]
MSPASLCPDCRSLVQHPLPQFCPSCGFQLRPFSPPERTGPASRPAPVPLAAPPAPTGSRPAASITDTRPPARSLEARPITGPSPAVLPAPRPARTGPEVPRLEVYAPDGGREEFKLDGSRITIGRHPANPLRVPDREVSKEHAALQKVGAHFLVTDLGSSNGTFVNGKRIRELRLQDGDELVVGNSKFVFRAGTAETLPAAGGAPRGVGGVTIVGANQSSPAFVAQVSAVEEAEFRPAEKITDPAVLRQDYEKLRLAHEFHRQVGVELDQKSLLDKILKVSFQLLAADNGVIFLADAQGRMVPAALGRKKGTDGDMVVSDTVLQRVTETRAALLTSDAVLDSRFSGSESLVARGVRSAMAVPLVVKDALKGVLFLDSRARINAFSEKDLKLLSGIAAQAAVALENAEMARKIELDAVARAELSRFLSPKVAEMVVSGQVELLRQGTLAEVTTLFADIRGFTTFSESEAPQEVVDMLNAFFTAASEVVFRNEGNLDKFIGDCVMATWGPPSAHEDDAARALRAGLEMQDAVRTLNAQRAADGLLSIEVGIGINTGQAVVGYMGSEMRHEFTAIGDAVNTASRLCGVCHGGEVLASAVTVARAGPGFAVEAQPPLHVKGKEKAVETYVVRSAPAVE